MAGMKFEYDEKGGTFYYFLLSFCALIVIPATYYLWPRKTKKDDEKSKRQCYCEPCLLKRTHVNSKDSYSNLKKRATQVVLIIGWVILIFLAYKVSTLELDHVEYDPFVELEIDREASQGEIKKAYRKLSLKYHPDKEGGDPHKFMRIAKAYAALTDEESRNNWMLHGNPDGPGATQFGIALPKWIVEKENSIWVLALYGLAFIIILPIVVGTWWYKSIKFSADQILLDTTQLYLFFFHKTPNMIIRRVIMILAGSFEFEKSHNNEIVERPSDNEELPPLMKYLPNLQEKNKEKPLCFPYSVKARILLHAHFSRLELPRNTLELDKNYILKKCPYLVNEMVNTVAQLVALAYAGRAQHLPRLETVENVMKVSQMLVQALWETKSPLLQLPHISEDMLKHFVTRKRNIRSIKQFASMNEEDRRLLLRTLSDSEYRDVMNVCAQMPHIDLTIKSEVIDEEDSSITAGSIVTATVTLVRKNIEEMFNIDGGEEEEDGEEKEEGQENDNEEEEDQEDEENKEANEVTDSPKRKTKPWEKQQKKKKGKGGGKNKKKAPKQPYKRPVATNGNAPGQGDQNTGVSSEGVEDVPKKPKKEKNSDREDGSESENESDSDVSGGENEKDENEDSHKEGGEDDDEDPEWMKKFQKQAKKENSLETKSKISHSVHCPYFPLDKQEYWWLYVADRKNHQLITAPVLVTSLRDTEELQITFKAPDKPGIYQFSVNLRSDSYMDFDITQNIKLDVKEAKKIENHPQWDISDEEDENKDDEDEDVTDSEASSEEDSDEE
ncbi:translocation protein SEC63 homolog [Lingula anatina]|uniref:Translocation protein SEC63 homolog n=1 Tax=Lingula anatina TaxID=7574 RepID=A0A1S3H7E2_LINAN|nr:translocation protein SEC63 homolog [Lingula anatina]|eukprot:XP_013381039.1 translocation protein SEC63 homolog [Lingula anatina]